MWSVRAVGFPKLSPKLKCGDHAIEWVKSYKYLGYLIATKLGWGHVISRTRIKIRQQLSLVNSIRMGGATSTVLRRVLHSQIYKKRI